VIAPARAPADAPRAAARAPVHASRVAARAWDQVSLYVPIILMGLLALGTYWLARNTPSFALPPAQRPLTHEPDYYMRNFSVKSFDAAGRLKSELHGAEARHYPDTDTLEVDQPRIRSYNERGALTVATADRAVSNADGSQAQLIGNAVVVREGGGSAPRLEIRGEFLHVYMQTERVKSDRPVVMTRGDDRFSADSLDYDNLDRVLQLQGRVRGTLSPRR
jgi:lipopolysaccharide export system protein LptC